MAATKLFETLVELQQEKDYKKRYHRLNNLVRTLSEGDVNIILNDLLLDDQYHVFLRIQIIKRFQVYSNIIEILKGKQINLIENVLRFNFLFKGESELKTWEFCRKNMFPVISFSTRVKLLNNLTKFNESTEQVEEFFNGINSNYTLRQALILLPACSCEFIKKIIVKYNLSLSASQLHKIVRYHPELGFWYLKRLDPNSALARKSRTSFYTHKSELKYLIQIGQLNQFIEFFVKYSAVLPLFSVGLKVSKQILRQNRNLVLQTPELYATLLRRNIIIGQLNDLQISEFYSGLFPKDISDLRYRLTSTCFNDGLLTFIKKFPVAKQQELLVYSFKQNYGKDLMAYNDLSAIKEFITMDVICILPAKQRENWAMAKLEDDPVNHEYLAMLPIEQSIPKIRDLLYKASDSYKRSRLIESLINTCYINRNTEAFAKVLTFLVDRYRNDDFHVRFTIITTLEKYCDQFNTGLEHWKPIEDCIRMFAVKKEYRALADSEILRKCINYRASQNQSIDEFVQIVIKAIEDDGYRRWRIMSTKPLNEKEYVMSLIRNVYVLHPKDSDFWSKDVHDLVIYLVQNIHDWNKEHQADEVPYDEYAFLTTQYEAYLKTSVLSDPYSQYTLLYTLMKRPDKLQELRHKMLAEKPTIDIINYFLKTDRKQIANHLDTIIRSILESGDVERYLYVLRKLKTLTFGDACHLIISTCLGVIELDVSNCKCAVELFCRFASEGTASTFLSPYFPTEQKITEERDENLHELRVNIAQNIWRVNPVINLETIHIFMQTDFLTKCLGSLYSVCLRTQCDTSVTFLKKILKGKVSIKKHILRLLCKISTADEVTALLVDFNTETNPSMRYVTFIFLFEILIAEQRGDIFNILIKCVPILSEKDEKIWDKLLVRMNEIPEEFLAEFIQRVWKTLESSDFTDQNTLNDYKRMLLMHITDDTASLLPITFFENILNQGLFSIKAPSILQISICTLATIFLYRSGNESENLQAVKCISELYKARIGVPLKDADYNTEIDLRRLSMNFFNDVFHYCKIEAERDSKLRTIRALTKAVTETLLTNYAIIDLFTLQSTQVTIEFYQDVPTVAAKMAAIYDGFASQFGIESIALFLHVFTSSIIQRNSKLHGDDATVEYAMNCLKASDSLACQMIVANILPTEMVSSSAFSKHYCSLFQQLQNSQHNSVKTYLKNKSCD